jgi:glutamine amidotransferase
MITVIDYGRGNLFSLSQALAHVGAAYEITSDPERLAVAERIVFPGVGAFGDAAAGLRSRKLEAPLVDAARRGTPILGICVGCQLLLEDGEEFGTHKGVGLIGGAVRRLPDPAGDDPAAIRVPNVGWRRLEVRHDDPLLGPVGDGMVYFVHSYAPMVAADADAAAHLTINRQRTPVAVRRGNVAGVQFHPEKSGPVGLALLARFARWSGF